MKKLKWRLVENYEGELSNETKYIFDKIYGDFDKIIMDDSELKTLIAIRATSTSNMVLEDISRLIGAISRENKISIEKTV